MIDYEVLARMELFSGIEPDALAGLLGCLSARRAEYAKDEFIVEEGITLLTSASSCPDMGALSNGTLRVRCLS